MHTINWYPGHMAKARRMLEDNLKLVDMIIEIVDARAPMACRNPDFEALFKNKLRVVVLNKSDLSSKTQNRAIRQKVTSLSCKLFRICYSQRNMLTRVA